MTWNDFHGTLVDDAAAHLFIYVSCLSMVQVYGSRTNNLRLATVVRRMLEEGGVTSLWRGNAINIVKVIPEMALKFMIYEQVGSSISCFALYVFFVVVFLRWSISC